MACLKLANGAKIVWTLMASKDFTITLPLYKPHTTGSLEYIIQDGNAMIRQLECLLVISGKSSFVRNHIRWWGLREYDSRNLYKYCFPMFVYVLSFSL